MLVKLLDSYLTILDFGANYLGPYRSNMGFDSNEIHELIIQYFKVSENA